MFMLGPSCNTSFWPLGEAPTREHFFQLVFSFCPKICGKKCNYFVKTGLKSKKDPILVLIISLGNISFTIQIK